MNKHAQAVTDRLKDRLAFLRTGKDHQFELLKRLFEGDSENLFYVDLVAIGALQRSAALIDGFALLVEHKNALAAAPLLRLQLDSAMRFNACWLVPDSSEVAKALLCDKPLKNLKGLDGNPLTDAYLRKALAERYPWIDELYRKGSGFIHMSVSHLTAAITAIDRDDGRFHMLIGPGREWRDDEMLDAVNAFIDVTNIIYELCIEYRETRKSRRAPLNENV